MWQKSRPDMKATKVLREKSRDFVSRKYPHVPAHGLPNKQIKTSSSNGLTSAVLQWLQLNGHWATRINTTGRWMPGQSVVDAIGRTRQMQGQYIPGTTRNGTADIHSVINGRHISLEVKIGRDRMSEAQKATQRDIEASGGIYLVIRSFDEFMTFYKEITLTTIPFKTQQP